MRRWAGVIAVVVLLGTIVWSGTAIANPPSGPSTTWSNTAATISSNTAAGMFTPGIALSSDGLRSSALWSRPQSPSDTVVFNSGTVSSSTSLWQSEVARPPYANSPNPSFAASDDGSKVAVIWRGETSINLVIGGVTAGQMVWGNTITLSSGASAGAASTSVAISADGNRVAVTWEIPPAGEWGKDVYVRIGSISGNDVVWDEAATMWDESLVNRTLYPQVALSADGLKAAVAWTSYAGNPAVSSSVIVSGTASQSNQWTWGTPARYSDGYSMSSVKLGLTPDGSAGAFFVRGYSATQANANTYVLRARPFTTSSGSVLLGDAAVILTGYGACDLKFDANFAKFVAVRGTSTDLNVSLGEFRDNSFSVGTPTVIDTEAAYIYSPMIALSADASAATITFQRSADYIAAPVYAISGAIQGTSSQWGSRIQVAPSPNMLGYVAIDGNEDASKLALLYFSGSSSNYSARVSIGQVSYANMPVGATSLSPASGSAAGGEVVNFTGSNFWGVTDVKFGNTSASSITNTSFSSISAVAPPGSGTVDVTITSRQGSVVLPAAYSYAAAPTPTPEPTVDPEPTQTAQPSPSPEPTADPTQAPVPDPKPLVVKPGSATSSVNGQPVQLQASAGPRTIRVVGEGFANSLNSSSSNGVSLPLDANGAPMLQAAGTVNVRGTGALPNSTVEVVLSSQSRARVGVAPIASGKVAGDGSYALDVTLPSTLAKNVNTLTIGTITAAGAQQTVSFGVRSVGASPVTVIRGTRGSGSKFVMTGVTTIATTSVRTSIAMSGATQAGPKLPVDRAGRFAMSCQIPSTVQLRVNANSHQSNTVVIPAAAKRMLPRGDIENLIGTCRAR